MLYESMKQNNTFTVEFAKEYEKHFTKKEESTKRYKAHRNLSKTDKSTNSESFDLHKLLNTPFEDNMLLFYSRNLVLYNFVDHENGTRDG